MPDSPPPCKTFKTFDEQAEQLMTRHLDSDKDDLISRLKAVNYYRLTGYLHIFRETVIDSHGDRTKADTYRKGTTLDLVWRYYLFDRRLRLLLLDAIERIEITLRTHIAYYWAKSAKCSNPQKFSTSYKPGFNKIILIQNFQCSDVVFFTSLITLIHHARNACAHHARVWNKTWNQSSGSKNSPSTRAHLNPIVKNTSLTGWNLQWDRNQWAPRTETARQFSFQKTSTAFLLTVCNYFLRTSANTSTWNDRLMELLTRADTPSNVIVEMGFPKHWEKHPLWTN